MTDDIVTRLREHQNPHYPLDEAADDIEEYRADLKRHFDMITQQRDQIERLRKERIRWERIAHDLYRRVDVYGEVCSCNDYDKHWCGLHAYEDEIRGLKERGSA